jgi:acetyltransferase-like isoleucine patch superfamily enzyme
MLIERLIKKLFIQKRNMVKNKFNRVLPLNELLTDRWEKATYLGFGKGTSIYDSSLVIGNVTVGENTWIGPFTVLDGSGGLQIGNNCSISAGVQIYSHDSVQWAVTGGVTPYQYGATSIGNNCYIGPNTIIEKGVDIGNNVTVGANSFVNKNLEDNKKYAGNPAKEI